MWTADSRTSFGPEPFARTLWWPARCGRADAVLCEPTADDLLGDATTGLPAVDVGGVEEVEAELERSVHDREALALSRLWTEVHRAEAEAAHLESRAPELHVLHDRLLRSPIDELAVFE